MQLPIPTWASEPELLFDCDFTALIAASATAAGATAPEQLFDSAEQNWVHCSFGATAGTSQASAVNPAALGAPGVVQIATSGITSNTACLWFAREPSSALHTEGIIAGKRLVGWEITLTSAVNTATNVSSYFGFGSDISANFALASSVHFFGGSASVNWQCVCAQGGASSTADSGVTFGTGRIQLAAYQKARASWEFFINRRRVAEITSAAHQPTSDLTFGALIQNLATGSRNFQIDRARAWALASTRWS